MKKILVIGAGTQGGPCATILARDKSVSQIVLSDIDIDLANRVKRRINSEKINTLKLDANNINEIAKAASGFDIIINLTLCRFNKNIMEAALQSGIHYIDSAFDDPIWTQMTENTPIEMDSRFKEAGCTALVGCGGAPGLINVFTRYICDKMDTVEEIHINVGDKLLEKQEDVITTWQPQWCPEIALTDYSDEPTVFIDGQYKKYPPFSGLEYYNFPEPVGQVLIGYHHHEEAVTLPRYIGKGVKYVGFKYPIDLHAAALVKMGFTSVEPISVKGVNVAPRDVLLRMVKPPVEIFFTENEKTAGAPIKHLHPYLVDVVGRKDGEEIKIKVWYPHSLFSTSMEKLDVYKKFGTTIIAVALPVIAGAKMCLQGDTPKGLISPECLDPIEFLKMMAQIGWPVKFNEEISKTTSIS